jgi:cardiolipin synthase A/B
LEAGVRVFEGNGVMLHAKTSIVEGGWARVSSLNLNIASWLGNCELDVVAEDESFARQRHPRPVTTSGGGNSGRAAAGAISINNAVGAAFTNRRVLEPVEARLMMSVGALLLALAALFAKYPRAFVAGVSCFHLARRPANNLRCAESRRIEDRARCQQKSPRNMT